MSTDLRGRVRDERRRRGMSVRAAATAGGISNTTWGRYESGDVTLSPGMVRAITQAFDWPEGWQDSPPEISRPDDLEQRVARLERDVHLLAEMLERSVEQWRDERVAVAEVLAASESQSADG